ncbi:hypothetical protein WG66_012339 [Moniliophthora roreri]|nr:hypothetical protein WG66_012339 [Moniliophthora roreri]
MSSSQIHGKSVAQENFNVTFRNINVLGVRMQAACLAYHWWIRTTALPSLLVQKNTPRLDGIQSRMICLFAGYTVSRNTGEEFKLPSELPCTPLLGGYT